MAALDSSTETFSVVNAEIEGASSLEATALSRRPDDMSVSAVVASSEGPTRGVSAGKLGKSTDGASSNVFGAFSVASSISIPETNVGGALESLETMCEETSSAKLTLNKTSPAQMGIITTDLNELVMSLIH